MILPNQHYAPGLRHRLDQRAWKSNKRLPVPTAWVITIVKNTENPPPFPLLHNITFKSKMYLISSPLPFKVPRKHKQESAKSLWVTDADWLENTPEVVPESWKFYPVFHMHSTVTSANPPLDRTMMCTPFPHPTDGERDFWHTNCSLTEYLNPDRGHIIDTSTAAAPIKIPLQKRPLAIAFTLSVKAIGWQQQRYWKARLFDDSMVLKASVEIFDTPTEGSTY